MKLRTSISGGLALAVIFSCSFAQAQDDKIARGKYLAEEVAKCQDCHTPKMDNGDFIKSQWMKGAALGFTPAAAVPGWRPKSPDITSTSTLWKRWTDDGLVKFLETGKNPRGNKAGVPMPAYALRHEDAEAIAAFLKSLP